jgi:predicted amidophosphoribosyltransferase
MNPWDPVREGYCPTCESWTTNYNRRGECSECGTEVREDDRV